MELLELPTTRRGLVLIELRPGDSDALFALIDRNREHLSKFGDNTAGKYPDHGSVLKSILSPEDPLAQRFGIWDKNVLVGFAKLTIEGRGITTALKARLGYYLGEEYVGHGYASTATRTLCDYAFDMLGCTSVYAFVHEENHASRNVLRACGFREVQRVGGNDLRYVLDKKNR